MLGFNSSSSAEQQLCTAWTKEVQICSPMLQQQCQPQQQRTPELILQGTAWDGHINHSVH